MYVLTDTELSILNLRIALCFLLIIIRKNCVIVIEFVLVLFILDFLFASSSYSIV